MKIKIIPGLGKFLVISAALAAFIPGLQAQITNIATSGGITYLQYSGTLDHCRRLEFKSWTRNGTNITVNFEQTEPQGCIFVLAQNTYSGTVLIGNLDPGPYRLVTITAIEDDTPSGGTRTVIHLFDVPVTTPTVSMEKAAPQVLLNSVEIPNTDRVLYSTTNLVSWAALGTNQSYPVQFETIYTSQVFKVEFKGLQKVTTQPLP
jgi:hypothetical protein